MQDKMNGNQLLIGYNQIILYLIWLNYQLVSSILFLVGYNWGDAK